MQKKQGIESRREENRQGEVYNLEGGNSGAIDTIRVHGSQVTPEQFVGHKEIADATFSPAVLLLKELGVFIRGIGPATCLCIHIGVIPEKKGVMRDVAIFPLHHFYSKPVSGQNLGLDLLEQIAADRQEVASHAGNRLRPVLIGFP